MQKYYLTIAALVGLTTCVNGQGLFNQTNLHVESGAVLHVDANYDNQPGSALLNAGEVRVSGNFNNSGNPEVDELVVLYGANTQSITGLTRFNDILEVDKSGSSATVTSGTVEIMNILRLNSGNMNANGNTVIRSTATGTGLVDDFSDPSYNGSLTGNLRMQRWLPTNGSHYIGSAVNTANVSELSEIGLYGPNMGQLIPQPDCAPYALSFNSPYGAMLEWHEDGPWTVPGCTQSGWYVRSSGTMQNARGYGILGAAGQVIEIGGAAGNTSETTTVAYNGLANTNATGDGWHLVSNPFPSPMVWFAPPPGFDGQAQIWQTTGTYDGTYQAMLPSPASLIASSQGFFVRSSAGPSSFALPQSYRSLGDPPFYKQDLSNTFDIIVESGDYADKTRVRFGDEGETNGFDSMLDANKIDAPGAQPTLKTRFRGIEYSINSMPLEDHPMTVPMDLIPGVSGEFKFTAKLLDQFTVEAHVYLEDLKLDRIQELTVNPVYTFSADESDDPERFLLHFRLNGEDPMFTGEDVVMYAHDHSAFLFLPELEGKAELEVFNALGDLVFQTTNLNEGKNEINLSNLATGAYILRARVNDKPISKKVIL